MKSLSDIKTDMSQLYDQLKDGKIDLKTAAELANITGKNLKAEQLVLAREILDSQLGRKLVNNGPVRLQDLG